MSEVLVHTAETKVIVERENNRIGTLYPKEKDVREWSNLTEEWVEKYLTCRHCNKQLDDERFAWAYWKHERQICSSECLHKEQLNKYACCKKAVQVGCVCNYSTDCPDHGRMCHGSHD